MRYFKMIPYDQLKEGELIQFAGVHVLVWERLQREYDIPHFDFAFNEVETDETEKEGQS